MNKQKQRYEKPEITRVRFEDKALVSFHQCSKETRLERDTRSCCDIQDDQGHIGYNSQNLDPS